MMRMNKLVLNKESANMSRKGKKYYVEELDDKVRISHSTI